MVVVALALFVMMPSRSQAQSASCVYQDPETLLSKASLVLIGRVERVLPEATGNGAVVRVLKVIKGKPGRKLIGIWGHNPPAPEEWKFSQDLVDQHRKVIFYGSKQDNGPIYGVPSRMYVGGSCSGTAIYLG